MFFGGGLIGVSVDLGLDKMNGTFVLVIQSLVRDRDEESRVAMLFVPTVIAQFSYMKSFVQKESFQIQNDAKFVLKHLYFFFQQQLLKRWESRDGGSSLLFSK